MNNYEAEAADMLARMGDAPSYEEVKNEPVRLGQRADTQVVDDAEAEGFEVYDEGKFRFSAKNVFLTYPHFRINPEEFLGIMKAKHPIGKWLVSTERHADGDYHIHAYFNFTQKVDSRNPGVFDVQYKDRNYHPNIKKITKNIHKVYAYIMKDGEYIHNIAAAIEAGPSGYIRRQADWQAWERDIQVRRLEPIDWPVKMPDGNDWDPTTLGKKRHLWLVGPPDSGKTWWLHLTFAGKQAFWRPPGTEYPYETFNKESVIICDDVMPKFEEITNVTDGAPAGVYKQVFGKHRYKPVYWPSTNTMGWSNIMIIVSNTAPEEVQWSPDSIIKAQRLAAVLKRFNVFDCTPMTDEQRVMMDLNDVIERETNVYGSPIYHDYENQEN